MHSLFVLEHNTICGHLRQAYPDWDDDALFDRARLINSALMAKIHTVEWTPAILQHPTLQLAMRANWWGLQGEDSHEVLGRISESEVISGIPGSEQDHHGAPFQMTEEFVSVYRMHPLMPDELSIVDIDSNAETGRVPMALAADHRSHLQVPSRRHAFERSTPSGGELKQAFQPSPEHQPSGLTIGYKMAPDLCDGQEYLAAGRFTS